MAKAKFINFLNEVYNVNQIKSIYLNHSDGLGVETFNGRGFTFAIRDREKAEKLFQKLIYFLGNNQRDICCSIFEVEIEYSAIHNWIDPSIGEQVEKELAEFTQF